MKPYLVAHVPRCVELDDVLLETALRVWRHLRRLPAEGTELDRYIGRVARNVVRDMLASTGALVDRRGARAPRRELDPEGLDDDPDDPGLLARCRSILQGRQRELFVWRYVEGLSIEECARRRGRTRGSISSALARLHRKLRERLGPTLPFVSLSLSLPHDRLRSQLGVTCVTERRTDFLGFRIFRDMEGFRSELFVRNLRNLKSVSALPWNPGGPCHERPPHTRVGEPARHRTGGPAGAVPAAPRRNPLHLRRLRHSSDLLRGEWTRCAALHGLPGQ
ncbi:MAG: sigma-70 family RNA polymerase sigma factor [Planctomycetes bacterium]|nr:sigma-70 family RNA polymerase sigma factor [Planctomycetota bacterium]